MQLFYFFVFSILSFGAPADSLRKTHMKTKSNIHSLGDFKKNISTKLTAADARKIFGTPEKNLGSGLYIYEYPVREGGKIILSFSSKLKSAIYYPSTGSEKTLFIVNSDLNSLGVALKNYIESLSEIEREKIPSEFRSTLLVFTEGLENDRHSMIGGWYLDEHSVPQELTKWHVVSDHSKVAAKIDATRVGEKWIFRNLRFVSAKTVPSKRNK